MKAVDIILFIVLIEASAGFITGLGEIGLFPSNETVGIGEFEDEYVTWNVSRFNESIPDISSTGLFSYVAAAWEAVKIAFTTLIYMFGAIVCIYPQLVNTFHIPTQLSVFIQVGIYFVYSLAILQFISGRSTKNYE